MKKFVSAVIEAAIDGDGQSDVLHVIGAADRQRDVGPREADARCKAPVLSLGGSPSLIVNRKNMALTVRPFLTQQKIPPG